MKQNKKVFLGCFGSLLLIVLLIGGCVASITKGSSDKKEDSKIKESFTRNITAKEFTQEFKKRIKQSKSKVFADSVGKLEKVKDEKNRYSLILDGTGNAMIFIDTIENKKVKKVTLATSGKVANSYSVELQIAYNLLLQMMDNDLDLNQMMAVRDKLKIPDFIQLDDFNNYYNINNVGYNYVGSIEKNVIMLKAEYK